MLIFQDGFEQYGDMTSFEYAWESYSDCSLAGQPRDNHGAALRIAAGGNAVFNFGNVTTIYVGFALACEELSADFNIRLLDSNGDDQVTITMDTDGYWRLRLGGPSDTVVFTASKRRMFAGSYYYLELRANIDNSLGAVHVRLEEEMIAATINRSTQSTGIGSVSKLIIDNGSGGFVDVDDFYCIDLSQEEYWDKWLGDVKINTYKVNTDGTTTDWLTLNSGTPITTAHWQQVDDLVPDGDTTTIEAGDWYKTDSFRFSLGGLKEESDAAVMALSVLPLIRNRGSRANVNDVIGSEWRIEMELIRLADGYVKAPIGFEKVPPFTYKYIPYNFVRWRPESAHYIPNFIPGVEIHLWTRPTWPQ